MSIVDESKEYLANSMSNLADKIISGELKIQESPEFYFRVSVCEHVAKALEADNYVKPKCIAEMIATKISVNLSGLGESHLPHKDFLDKLAKDASVVIAHVFHTYSSEFNADLAMDMIKDLKIYID